MRCVNGSGNKKELEKCREYFFSIPFHETKCLFISQIAILPLIVMNNIRKKLVMITPHYGNQIIVNQSIISIKIINVDSNH